MRIDFPLPNQYEQLSCLWQEAFGDTEEFVDGFFCTAFSPSRCRCATVAGEMAAALYWMDVRFAEKRFAYIYAVAVGKNFRGRGLCAGLMADTHAHLALRGYAGALLVPQDQGLRRMYEKMGYRNCTAVAEFSAAAGETPLALQRIDREEYARLRREALPPGSAVEGAESIAYLETMAFFYRGEKVLLAAHAENGRLWCPELLGDTAAVPGILAALKCREGRFRTSGGQVPFAMFRPLADDAKPPEYLGFAFD